MTSATVFTDDFSLDQFIYLIGKPVIVTAEPKTTSKSKTDTTLIGTLESVLHGSGMLTVSTSASGEHSNYMEIPVSDYDVTVTWLDSRIDV